MDKQSSGSKNRGRESGHTSLVSPVLLSPRPWYPEVVCPPRGVPEVRGFDPSLGPFQAKCLSDTEGPDKDCHVLNRPPPQSPPVSQRDSCSRRVSGPGAHARGWHGSSQGWGSTDVREAHDTSTRWRVEVPVRHGDGTGRRP